MQWVRFRYATLSITVTAALLASLCSAEFQNDATRVSRTRDPHAFVGLDETVVSAENGANKNEPMKLDTFIKQGMQDSSLTGLAVAVVKDDKVVFMRGYGVRDLRSKQPIDEHTVFQIGSCTKPLTASGIALLVQNGSTKWDTPIIEMWREFRVSDRGVTERATLRDILCHRTGVGKGESALYYEMPITRADLLRRLPQVQQAAPFRTDWRYSNLMYAVAGRVVEQISGESWDAYMAKRVFQPLGMTRTHTSMKSLARLTNVAVPHVRVDDQTYATDFADQDNIGPAASIVSSVSDLSQWLLMMVNEGKHRKKELLKPEVMREMIKPQILMPFSDPVQGNHNFNACGLGFMLHDYHGLRIAKHVGMSGHSLAMLGYVPEKRIGVVVLTNHRPCVFHYAVFRRAIDLYCGMPQFDLDSTNKKLIAEHFARQEQSLKRRADARDPNKKPTLPLDRYAGPYERDFGLRASLEMDSDRLVLRYGNIVADVTHWHDDTFRARLRKRRLASEQDWYLTFTVVKGLITKLHVHSEHDIHADFVPVRGDQPHSSQPTLQKKPDGELRRRAMFGGQLAAITKEVRDRQKLDGDSGVVLEKIFPDTSAAGADFKAGDVILAIDGVKIVGVSMFLKKVEEARAGDVLVADVVRDGVKSEKRVKLKEMPREKGDGYDVIYSSVTSQGARLRTIITRPKTAGRHPAVLLLQGGHTCFSVDNPVGTPFGFTWVARSLAKKGYVTMRVERPGCGDSEGGPLRDVDFDTELEGYKEALKALTNANFVDPDNVFLFGHSQGGINAPLMAVDIPVKGIAVFGTVPGGSIETMLSQRRRLAMLDGTAPADVDGEVRDQARFWYPLLIEKKTPRQIREQYPDLPKRILDQWVTDDKYVSGRIYTFYHQGANKNLAEAWTKVASTRLHPRVLAIWGTSDWLVDRAGNAWIAEVVNRVKPGNGKFVAIESVDHFFLRTSGPEESYRYFKPVKGMPPTEFHRPFIEVLSAWLDETAGRAKKAPGKP